MLRKFLESLMNWLRRVVTQPREELNRWQRATRFAYDLGRYGGRQLKQDNAPQMAAALAFRTLFALLPVLVVSMILVKATKGAEAFLELTREILTSLNLGEVRVAPPGGIPFESADSSMSLAAWLEELIGQAAHVNLAAVGWIGVAVIGYAAISLMVTIENSFNAIYRAPEGRPWTRRIPLYWFVLTISPVAMGVTWYLNSHAETWINVFQEWQTLLVCAGVAWSTLVGWLVLLAVYMLLPNTRIALRPAMAGALVATLLFEIGKRSLDAYLGHAISIRQLYGSLGLVPLFMFWVYLMWLVVLFGLEVCATLQRLGGRELEEIEPPPSTTGMFDPASVITVMEKVAERFATGQPIQAQQIAETTLLPETVVRVVLGRLIDAGILHRIDRESDAVTLALPPEKVTADELIEIGFQIVDEGGLHRQSPLVERLRDAQRELLAQTTLAGNG